MVNNPGLVVREISSLLDKRYRALVWSSREFRILDTDLSLVNKIASSVVSIIEKSLATEHEEIVSTEPQRVLKTVSIKSQLSSRGIESLLFVAMTRLLYTDLPSRIALDASRYERVLVCPVIYYYNKRFFKRVVGGCGGRVCEGSCGSYRIEVFPVVVGQELGEDVIEYEESLFEDLLDDITAIEDKIKSTYNIDKIVYPETHAALLGVVLKKSESEAVEVYIREGLENMVIRLDLRKPVWGLDMFPRKIVSEIETLIVDPIKKGYKFAPRGVLLVGPPGVGKTVLAEAMASGIGKKILDLRPSVYRSMWYGMTEKILERLLKSITNRTDLALLIDDAEFLVSRSLAIHEVHISEISILLRYLQNPNRPVTFLTSNTPALIDQALLRPGRIDVVVVLGYPDREGRRIIIENILRNYEVRNVPEEIVEELVRRTRWFNSAEIDSLIRMALSKGGGVLDLESIEWAKKRFRIDPNARAAEHQFLRWSVSSLGNLVIQYIPEESEI